MHNLSTVIRFEIVRTLKKKSFWIMALGFPLLFAMIFGIIFLSNKTTEEAAKDIEKQTFSIAVTDNSGIVKPNYLAALKADIITDKQSGIDRVKTGKLDAYFYYPADIVTQPVEVYGKDVGIFENSRYEAVAKSLLAMSVDASVSPAVKTVISGSTQTSFVAYKDGVIFDGIRQMILPGVFLVLFYFLMAFFGNQMLTSTTEEKENRVIEMILTTIEARTLIIGKIISMIALALVQAVLIVAPAVIGYLLLRENLSLPNLDLTTLPVDWIRIGIGFAVFSTSFLLFTGLLVAVGSALPTAKEAASYFGFFMMLLFGPLYAVTLFISSPDAPLVRFLSFFPLTAPIPLMLRNAAGNLSYGDAAIATAILFATATIVMLIAVRIFRYGALEYSRKLSLAEIFGRK